LGARLNEIDPVAADFRREVVKLESVVSSLESTVAKLKDDVSDLKINVRAVRDRHETDVRLLFVATMAIVSIAMAVMMAKGFGWIH
jgi:uncharacterized protein YlxW (UPF0749 family)